MSFKRDCDCAEPSGVYTRNDDVIALSALLLETNVFFTRVSAERHATRGRECDDKVRAAEEITREPASVLSRNSHLLHNLYPNATRSLLQS